MVLDSLQAGAHGVDGQVRGARVLPLPHCRRQLVPVLLPVQAPLRERSFAGSAGNSSRSVRNSLLQGSPWAVERDPIGTRVTLRRARWKGKRQLTAATRRHAPDSVLPVRVAGQHNGPVPPQEIGTGSPSCSRPSTSCCPGYAPTHAR
jgi:hypothetical protein